MIIRILGQVQITDDTGQTVTRLPKGQRKLICALALMKDPVPSAKLTRILWGVDHEVGRTAIGTLVYRTRQALPEGVEGLLLSTPDGFKLALRDSDKVDLFEFQHLVERAQQARDTDLVEAAGLYGKALALFPRGVDADGPIPDCPDAPELLDSIVHLKTLLQTAREALAETRLALGEHRQLLPDLQVWVASDPFDEHLRGRLMLALYRSGRRAEALAAFVDAVELLKKEGLGAEPGLALQHLHAKIVADDPALGPPAMVSPRRLPAEREMPGLIPDRPSVSRMLNYLLGGKDNFASDRDAVAKVMEHVPGLAEEARLHHRWRRRAIRAVAKAGVEQFIDLGAGLPDNGNVFSVAHEVTPQAKVVYVDADPMVATHARALLLRDPKRTAFVHADLRDVREVLESPEIRRLIDPKLPVGIVVTSVLHIVPGPVDEALAAYVQAMPPGSYLVLSAVAWEGLPGEVIQATRGLVPEYYPRTEAEIANWLSPLEVVAPGIEQVQHWRPEEPPRPSIQRIVGAVARKPGGRTQLI